METCIDLNFMDYVAMYFVIGVMGLGVLLILAAVVYAFLSEGDPIPATILIVVVLMFFAIDRVQNKIHPDTPTKDIVICGQETDNAE